MSEARRTEIMELEARGLRQIATGAAAVAMNIKPTVPFRLREIRIHLSAAGAGGSLTATVNSSDGAPYDINLITQDMTSVTDLVWQPDKPLQFESADEIDIAWANAGAKTYGIVVYYDLL